MENKFKERVKELFLDEIVYTITNYYYDIKPPFLRIYFYDEYESYLGEYIYDDFEYLFLSMKIFNKLKFEFGDGILINSDLVKPKLFELNIGLI